MITFDTETVGFTGPIVIIQYAEDNGPIKIHHVFSEPINDTLSLIEYIASQHVVAFNIEFDWFHLTKWYNILYLLKELGADATQPPNIEQLIEAEKTGWAKWCLRPPAATDVMLVARRGEFQYAMGRKPIHINRVPTKAVPAILRQLDNLDLPEILFAKAANKFIVTEEDDNPELASIKINFKPSTGLGALAQEILGEPKADWPIPRDIMPTEFSYYPLGQHGDRPWGSVIQKHINHWKFSKKALYYAERDVELTRKLYYYFEDSLPQQDIDSLLACHLGATRWRGFNLDHDKINELKTTYTKQVEGKQYANSPQVVMRNLKLHLPEAEQLVVKDTSKETLESVIHNSSSQEAKDFAAGVLDARRAYKRLDILEKLSSLDRWRPQFKVIGTKSNRMSGGSDESEGGSINPQGIPRDADIRSVFTLALPGEELWGGDADQFEVAILDGVTDCPKLRSQLLSGKKFHALMGEVWLGLSYEDVMRLKADGSNEYDIIKAADFAFNYGAQENKLASVLGIEVEQAQKSLERLNEIYPEVLQARLDISKKFCSMRQPVEGGNVEWHEPDDYVETILGFRRYFTVENKICKFLYHLAQSLSGVPKGTVVRRTERGEQTILGASKSALFAAAFALQQANMRAASNHVIQSVGGSITKDVQWSLCRHQPTGIHTWRVRVINIHDELLTVTDGTIDTGSIVQQVIEKYKAKIPLLSWGWDKLPYWSK